MWILSMLLKLSFLSFYNCIVSEQNYSSSGDVTADVISSARNVIITGRNEVGARLYFHRCL